ncbi:MAG: 50S ribosomal protein L19e [Candidatus Thermoplasmatota archaeon]
MNLRYQRRIAADLLKCGENRIWMNPEKIEEIKKAVTRRDIENLINMGLIKKEEEKGISRGRARKRITQKKKGRRKGHGSRKGKAGARLPSKERWIKTIRAIRAYLRELRDKGIINEKTYRLYYRRAKGGQFKNKAHLKLHLQMEGIKVE